MAFSTLFFGSKPPEKLEQFDELPNDIKKEILGKLPLKDLIAWWRTTKESSRALINDDSLLLKRLGVKSVEEFIARINSLFEEYKRFKYVDEYTKMQEKAILAPFHAESNAFKTRRICLEHYLQDETIHIRTAEILFLEAPARLTSLRTPEQIDKLLSTGVSIATLISIFKSDNTTIAIAEGWVTLEEYVDAMSKSPVRGIAKPQGFKLFDLYGFKALRLGWISFQEANSLKIDLDVLVSDDLYILKQRHHFLKNPESWQKSDALSKKDFDARFNALPGNLQVLVIGNIKLDTAEKLNQDVDHPIIAKARSYLGTRSRSNWVIERLNRGLNQPLVQALLIEKWVTLEDLLNIASPLQFLHYADQISVFNLIDTAKGFELLKSGVITIQEAVAMKGTLLSFCMDNFSLLRKRHAFITDPYIWKMASNAASIEEFQKRVKTLPIDGLNFMLKDHLKLEQAEEAVQRLRSLNYDEQLKLRADRKELLAVLLSSSDECVTPSLR